MKKSIPKKRFGSVAFQVDIARQVETPQTLKKIIDFGAAAGYNELFLYGEGALEYKSHPECSLPWALKQDEFKKLQKHAKKYDMRIIPIIPILGHANYILKTEKLEHLREIKNPADAILKCDARQFCSSKQEALEVIEDLLSEWAEIVDAPHIHIGGDESWNFALCPECKKEAEKIGRGRMLAEYFNKINTIVKKHGKKSMIWHDMLFYYDNCLTHIDKDIVFCDWHYKPIERHPGISIYNWIKTDFQGTYEKEKISAYICPKSKCKYTEEANNIKTLIEYTENKKPIGFLNTVWEQKTMPYASCYPALAYGGAACNKENLPEPRAFLHEFAGEHFSSGSEILPMLVDLFEETAELKAFSTLNDWINYQDPTPDLTLAGKLDEALVIAKKLKGKTVAGKAYKEALGLIFARMAISKRLQGLVNETARALRPERKTDKIQIKEWLKDITEQLENIPAQIKLEEKIWDKYRPREQSNPVTEQFLNLQKEISNFVSSIKKIMSGKAQAVAELPRVLELTMVNNDCSWQYLTISTSTDGKQYTKIGNYPQCGPFGRYVKTFALPHMAKFVKLELAGLGQLLLHYARIIDASSILSPNKIKNASGQVSHPERLLVDDFRPTIMGNVESKGYFSQAKEQPMSAIEIKMS